MKEFVVTASGHPNIRATHKTTWQVTKENELSIRGDCIIGINSSVSTQTLPSDLKTALKSGNRIEYNLSINGLTLLEGEAIGNDKLTLDDPIDIVLRKSEFISPRTLAIKSSHVASSIPRKWIPFLQDPETVLEIRFKY